MCSAPSLYPEDWRDRQGYQSITLAVKGPTFLAYFERVAGGGTSLILSA